MSIKYQKTSIQLLINISLFILIVGTMAYQQFILGAFVLDETSFYQIGKEAISQPWWKVPLFYDNRLGYGAGFWAFTAYLVKLIYPFYQDDVTALRAVRAVFVLFYFTPLIFLGRLFSWKNIMLSIGLVSYAIMPFAWWYGKMLSPEPLLMACTSLIIYLYIYHQSFKAYAIMLFLIVFQAGIKLNTLPFLFLLLFAFQKEWFSFKYIIPLSIVFLIAVWASNPFLFTDGGIETYRNVLHKFTGRWQIHFIFENIKTFSLVKLWHLEGFAFDGVLSAYGLFYFGVPLPILIWLFIQIYPKKRYQYKWLGLLAVGIGTVGIIFLNVQYYPWYWLPLTVMCFLVFFYSLKDIAIATIPKSLIICLTALIPFAILQYKEIGYQWFMSASQAEALRFGKQDKAFLQACLDTVSPDDICVLNYTIPYIGDYPLHYQRIAWAILAIINYDKSDSATLAPCQNVYFVGHRYLLAHHIAHTKYQYYHLTDFIPQEFMKLYPNFLLTDTYQNERLLVYKFSSKK